MRPATIDIQCGSYSVKTDIYEGNEDKPIILSLIGRTSKRTKQRYLEFFPRLSKELGVTTVIFDYTGHGDSPFELAELKPAQHFFEVITVFDWIKEKYPNRKIIVIGSSYGGFLATKLIQYRNVSNLILRAPAIYKDTDFYTSRKDEDREATFSYRQNTEALLKSPLLQHAAKFEGKTLLVVHENDEQIPKETTNAYAKAFSSDISIAKGVPHSLDDATEEQIADYNQQIIYWLKKLLNSNIN